MCPRGRGHRVLEKREERRKKSLSLVDGRATTKVRKKNVVEHKKRNCFRLSSSLSLFSTRPVLFRALLKWRTCSTLPSPRRTSSSRATDTTLLLRRCTASSRRTTTRCRPARPRAPGFPRRRRQDPPAPRHELEEGSEGERETRAGEGESRRRETKRRGDGGISIGASQIRETETLEKTLTHRPRSPTPPSKSARRQRGTSTRAWAK